MKNNSLKILNILFIFIIFFSLTVSIVTTNSLSVDNLIYIDPGHGGDDKGATGVAGIFEKEIVLNISFKLKNFLNKAGYNVLLTRQGDYDLAPNYSLNKKRDDIHNRVKLINESNCLLYVSIHANIYSSPSIYGAQTFFKEKDDASRLLSEEIQAAIKAILQNTKREAKTISGKYLIEHSNPPGALVEVGFLSNQVEAKLLLDEYYQEKVAYAIYIGILSYLEKNK